MYFILFYKTVDQFVERRAPFREIHLNHAKAAQDRGELIMGGALTDPANEAVLVFKGADKSVAENFAIHDPYVQNGLITDWKVREWKVAIGN
jgi:uncharacterized protein YciI